MLQTLNFITRTLQKTHTLTFFLFQFGNVVLLQTSLCYKNFFFAQYKHIRILNNGIAILRGLSILLGMQLIPYTAFVARNVCVSA